MPLFETFKYATMSNERLSDVSLLSVRQHYKYGDGRKGVIVDNVITIIASANAVSNFNLELRFIQYVII